MDVGINKIRIKNPIDNNLIVTDRLIQSLTRSKRDGFSMMDE